MKAFDRAESVGVGWEESMFSECCTSNRVVRWHAIT